MLPWNGLGIGEGCGASNAVLGLSFVPEDRLDLAVSHRDRQLAINEIQAHRRVTKEHLTIAGSANFDRRPFEHFGAAGSMDSDCVGHHHANSSRILVPIRTAWFALAAAQPTADAGLSLLSGRAELLEARVSGCRIKRISQN